MHKFLGLILALITASFFFSGFTKADLPLVKKDMDLNIALRVNSQYTVGLESFLGEIQKFESLLQSGISVDSLKFQFLRTRESFKKVEFLLCYMESDEVRRVNGANISINEYHYKTPMDEKQPHGLQVMEDLIYNFDEAAFEELKKETVLLHELIKTTIDRKQQDHIIDGKEYNTIVWDAVRLELFRIETLGITGFDVPESLNSLPETKKTLRSLSEVIQLYLPKFKALKLRKELENGLMLLKTAEELLNNAMSFDEFNRLDFMTEVLHPLQRWVKTTTENMGYKYPVNLRAVNNDAAFLYDTLFYNQAFFAPGSTAERVVLGKKLFNDPIFSINQSRSCASCHIQGKGLADGLIKNTSIDGTKLLKRNTPTLWNAGYQTRFFYDSRAKRLEIQAMDVIHNPLEMGVNPVEVALVLKEDPEYKDLFGKAFNGVINKSTISSAIADYVRSLVSFNSRFDRYVRGEKHVLTDSEKRGFNIFAGKAKCATCHFAPMFNGLLAPHYKDNESEILGVPLAASTPQILDSDLGKFDNTKLELHRYAFKTPTVRNVELTAPFMHNGVFETLEEVVEFYEKGGGVGQGMDLPSQTLPDSKLKLKESEKKDLIAFLKALTFEPYL